jgi:hypothetical protein
MQLLFLQMQVLIQFRWFLHGARLKNITVIFFVSCEANNSTKSRSDWFKVSDGDNELRININQSGSLYPVPEKKVKSTTKNRKCFNCPNAKYTWGITAGYIQKSYNHTEGIQLGLRIEPLFKYGFGLNTGLNIEGYSTDLLNGGAKHWQAALNIPLHLEYRLNISKWFNVFAYGGAGFNFITNSIPATFEYGGGLRINHIQFNLGRSLYLGNLRNNHDVGISTKFYQDLILSVSLMF